MALDDVVILNVDTNTLETPYDDLQSLPNDVVRVYCIIRICHCFIKDVNIQRLFCVLMPVTCCDTGFIFKESFEEGFNNNRGRRGSSLPQEPGVSLRQLQKRSADRVGQFTLYNADRNDAFMWRTQGLHPNCCVGAVAANSWWVFSYVQGEPITFNEETFMNHRSSAMRQFLQNAIQLQLFKQVSTHTKHTKDCLSFFVRTLSVTILFISPTFTDKLAFSWGVYDDDEMRSGQSGGIEALKPVDYLFCLCKTFTHVFPLSPLSSCKRTKSQTRTRDLCDLICSVPD